MFTIDQKAKKFTMSLMIIGLIALIYGFISNPHGAWPALLFNTYFYLGISIFAVFFVALQYVAEAGWSIVLKRVPEAVMGALPIFSLIMLFIMIASILHWNHIYHWLHEGIMDPTNDHYDKIIAGKEPYLNATFFIIRTIIYLLGWNYFAKKLRSLSVLEDQSVGSKIHSMGISTSAWFMVFFAVTSSMASWDWIMSIDTHWFSTLFGWYVFAEWSAIGFTTIFLFTLYLKRMGYLNHVNENHIHDLGKWIFAFSLVWTYMWFSQFMLIWYANIPEEVAYFTARLEVDNYKFLFWFSMLINFLFPIILLMSRDAKRNNTRLIFVSCVILFGHWLNSYLLVAPGTLNTHGHIGITEIGIGLGFAGLLIYITLNALTKQPLETKNHPFLDESKNLHT
ncbi:MAG: quinol:cytochrome C oxidoreductase [Flavobacteriales bacterium]|nr:quinol:cytochrome C oxidoreductase [Flavobacteriales bacterium]MDG1933868.1 quinol:cytochrome C oxidoreductase [Flavobacteriales bacterium]MDG2086678.1 quinol:cytochrome C oxidoreductase [Flavobacteriales bacterium]